MGISKNQKPNIILIISDALRAKDLSLFGRNEELDKNLKKIASESIVFTNNFSTSGSSELSLNSIFSGQYPTTIGFLHQHPRTKKEEMENLRKIKFWLPVFLKEKGYDTISVTPLHIWFKKGFISYINEVHKGGKVGKLMNSKFIKRILLALPSRAYSLGKRFIKMRASPIFYPSNQVIDLAISKIKQEKKSFFLFMHFVDTHYPYPLTKHIEMIGKETLGEVLKKVKFDSQKEYIKKRFYDISAKSMEEIKKRKDESIKYIDEQIGRLYLFLKKRRLWEETIFIILSDHGDNFGEHNTYFCRGGLYDPSIHVPLIIHMPGIKPKRINALTSNIDIAPTLLDFLDEEKKKIDGKTLIPLMKKEGEFRKRIIVVDGFCENRIAVRTKTKKLIISKNGKCYLCGAEHGNEKEEYDMINDPEELKNIYSKKSELDSFLTKL